MTKRIFLIHGWEGSPQKDWLAWVENQLEQKATLANSSAPGGSGRGYQVHVPEMPNTDNPEKKAWINKLSQVVGKLEHTDILVGHSLGCQTILRYLESQDNKCDKVILVAPWNTLSEEIMSDADDSIIARSWTEAPINFEKVRGKANSFIALFSKNDPLVPFEENNKWLNENLEVQTVVYLDKGHFNMSQLPEILKFF